MEQSTREAEPSLSLQVTSVEALFSQNKLLGFISTVISYMVILALDIQEGKAGGRNLFNPNL